MVQAVSPSVSQPFGAQRVQDVGPQGSCGFVGGIPSGRHCTGVPRAGAMAGRARLSALSLRWSLSVAPKGGFGQPGTRRPPEVQGVSPPVHRDRRDRVREESCRAQQVASGDRATLSVSRWAERRQARPTAGGVPANRPVFGAPRSAGAPRIAFPHELEDVLRTSGPAASAARVCCGGFALLRRVRTECEDRQQVDGAPTALHKGERKFARLRVIRRRPGEHGRSDRAPGSHGRGSAPWRARKADWGGRSGPGMAIRA
jgi:hypothetical protein